MDGDEDMEETFGKRSKHGGDFGEEYRAKVDFTSGGGGGVDFTSGGGGRFYQWGEAH